MRDKGDFLSCSKYPQCKGSYDKKGLEKAKKNDSKCPDCGSWMVERRGAKGPFLGCSAYPRCKHSEPIPGKQQGRGTRK
jgi:ssDNA-binding Zn-finger/Zn-ribbon topoisomerase 1